MMRLLDTWAEKRFQEVILQRCPVGLVRGYPGVIQGQRGSERRYSPLHRDYHLNKDIRPSAEAR